MTEDTVRKKYPYLMDCLESAPPEFKDLTNKLVSPTHDPLNHQEHSLK
jgi:hypothetical protein